MSKTALQFLIFVCLTFGFISSAFAIQTIGGKRGTQFFAHYSYRFLVPQNQTEAISQYLNKKNRTSQPDIPVEKEILTEFYFDDEKKTLKKQNIILRHRVKISSENRKERIQLFLPASGNSTMGKEIVFRHNRKPDKGADFTSHPLLKLLRKKDRPVLDSLLKTSGVQSTNLKPVLEITQHREQFHLQKHNSNWLTITLTQMRAVNAENEYWELQLSPDQKLLTHGAADVKKQLIQDIQRSANELKTQFPELQQQTKTEYAALLELNNPDRVKKKNPNLLPWLGLLLALVIAFVVYKLRKKRLQ